ncbi:MAG: TatD family hydrolase [Oscillospiraceae bacterium]|nr:TatD family hydrolase [Oscillospiraceae bacterium]
MTQYYDIGLNLFSKQFREPEKIISNAEAAGVTCILTGSDMQENRKVAAFVENHAVYGTCGIHPHGADRARREDFTEMERIHTEHSRIVAVGECGLDFDRMFSTRENQIRCLEQHIVLAEKLGKPMFLHERSASADFVKRFQSHKEVCRRSVVHCFTGTRKELETYLEMGFCIGITGWICDARRADDLRAAVKILPLDRVLVETDAPYLTPRNVKGLGRTNVPENVRYVVETLAGYMHTDPETLRQAAKANTERLFGIGGDAV